jgi:predicted DNA-binding transcriptional regulator YafY
MATGQEKLSRLLKVISMLNTPHGRTIQSMANELESSPRTVYRYIDTLEASGFPIDKSCAGERWFIVNGNNQGNILNFNIDEANLIKDLIENGAHNHPLKDVILGKLYVNSDLKPLAEYIIEARMSGIVSKLRRAVEKEYKVILRNYHSVSSNAIRDYLIEPYKITKNLQAVDAYDIRADKNKQFRTCRIGDVQVLEKKQTHQGSHSTSERDPFGFQGDNRIEVILKLNHSSVTVLKELYKGTYDNLTKINDEYIFHGTIHYVEGVGRFILSQIDNVKIIKGAPLIDYISEKLNAFNRQLRPERILPGVTKEALLA